MEALILRWSQRSFKNHSLVSENGGIGFLFCGEAASSLPSPLGNAIKLSKILIAHVGNSVCFFHAFFLKVNNKTKN